MVVVHYNLIQFWYDFWNLELRTIAIIDFRLLRGDMIIEDTFSMVITFGWNGITTSAILKRNVNQSDSSIILNIK